ncbi:MAG: Hsp33 family molecular chaperone HslO, partial [Desulfurobacteriaceae bacterium]
FTTELLALKELSFKCKCSKEVARGGLVAMPEEELEKLIEEGQASVKCNFCGEEYVFTKEELQEILEEKRKGNN